MLGYARLSDVYSWLVVKVAGVLRKPRVVPGKQKIIINILSLLGLNEKIIINKHNILYILCIKCADLFVDQAKPLLAFWVNCMLHNKPPFNYLHLSL